MNPCTRSLLSSINKIPRDGLSAGFKADGSIGHQRVEDHALACLRGLRHQESKNRHRRKRRDKKIDNFIFSQNIQMDVLETAAGHSGAS